MAKTPSSRLCFLGRIQHRGMAVHREALMGANSGRVLPAAVGQTKMLADTAPVVDG